MGAECDEKMVVSWSQAIVFCSASERFLFCIILSWMWFKTIQFVDVVFMDIEEQE